MSRDVNNLVTAAVKNDLLRAELLGGRFLMSPEIWELGLDIADRVLIAVRSYNDFGPDSDHDFGAFIIEGRMFVWRISYAATEDIEGPGITPDSRILMVMLEEC
jgi:hypothetical protein